MRLRSVLSVLEQSLCLYVYKNLYTLLYGALSVLIHIVVRYHSQLRLRSFFNCFYVYIRRSIFIVCFLYMNFISGYAHQFSQLLYYGSCFLLTVFVYLYVCGHLSKVKNRSDYVYVLFGEFNVFDGLDSLGETVRDRYSLRELENLPRRCRS